MIDSHSKASNLLFIAAASIMGVASLVIPYLITYGYVPEELYDAPLFPLLRSSWEGLNPVVTALILVMTGMFLGFIRGQKWRTLGLSSVLLLVLAAIIEMVVSPSSHNLWPMEFLMYVIFIAGPMSLGAFVGFKFKLWGSAT
jgi:VIT1/CCC1 family predicted Fe2+/Mn2+ transporter